MITKLLDEQPNSMKAKTSTISQSEIRNSAAGKNWNRKARAGKNSFPSTPFLFARLIDWILKLGIRIFVKECSNFVQKTPPAYARASAGKPSRFTGFVLRLIKMWYVYILNPGHGKLL
jgi:hypothetical protein